MLRCPIIVGGGTPLLAPVADAVPLQLVEARMFGSEVIYERYRRVRDVSGRHTPTGTFTRSAGACRKRIPCGPVSTSSGDQ
ncbi:hypothetical protein ACFFX0_32845 [Citricoccus parietis]